MVLTSQQVTKAISYITLHSKLQQNLNHNHRSKGPKHIPIMSCCSIHVLLITVNLTQFTSVDN